MISNLKSSPWTTDGENYFHWSVVTGIYQKKCINKNRFHERYVISPLEGCCRSHSKNVVTRKSQKNAKDATILFLYSECTTLSLERDWRDFEKILFEELVFIIMLTTIKYLHICNISKCHELLYTKYYKKYKSRRIW